MVSHGRQKDGNDENVYLKVEGPAAIAAYVLNGIVGLGGILLFVLGMVSHGRADDLCKNPAGCEDTWATIVLVVGGFFLFGTMVFAILGIFKSDSPLLINALRAATLAYIVLGFFIMVATVVFALGSGVLDAINDRYEENWEQIRDEATNLDP